MNTFYVHNTTISFVNNDENNKHYGLFHRMLNMLSDYEFAVSKDNNVANCLKKHSYVGKKGELKFKASRYEIGFKIEFYQDVNFENPNGGYYDFDKFAKMPYLIQKQFQCTVNKISALLSQFAENVTEPTYNTAEEKIKHDYATSSIHPQRDMNFALSDLDGTTCDGHYNNYDRDKIIIHNGDTKYFRDSKGYLCRGKVYHNINNMWWVIMNDTTVCNVAAFELFDLSDTDERKRKVDHNPPKAYVERKMMLWSCSTKELKNELKRRAKLQTLLRT